MWFKYGLKAQKLQELLPFQGVWGEIGRVGKTCESSVF